MNFILSISVYDGNLQKKKSSLFGSAVFKRFGYDRTVFNFNLYYIEYKLCFM